MFLNFKENMSSSLQDILMHCFKTPSLRHWISNPGVLCSKPLGDSKVDSVFHPSEFDQMSAKNFWKLSDKK